MRRGNSDEKDRERDMKQVNSDEEAGKQSTCTRKRAIAGTGQPRTWSRSNDEQDFRLKKRRMTHASASSW